MKHVKRREGYNVWRSQSPILMFNEITRKSGLLSDLDTGTPENGYLQTMTS